MKKVGLKRGTVAIVPYNPLWADEFEKEQSHIQKACKENIVAVEHIGSTSVPKLSAKPIIDIAVGVACLKNAKKLIKPLAKIGYHFYRINRYEIFFAKGPDACRTHYIHAVRYKGVKWQKDILLRNYLRTHPKEIREYAKLKTRLAKQFADDRYTYTAQKDAYIKSVIKKAETM